MSERDQAENQMVPVPKSWFYKYGELASLVILIICILAFFATSYQLQVLVPEELRAGVLNTVCSAAVCLAFGLMVAAMLSFALIIQNGKGWKQREAAIEANHAKKVVYLRKKLAEQAELSQRHLENSEELRELLQSVVEQRDALWAFVTLLFSRFSDFADFTDWLGANDDVFRQLRQQIDAGDVGEFATTFEAVHASFMRERDQWSGRRELGRTLLERRRMLSHQWMRRLMHRMWFEAGQLSRLKKASAEVRMTQDRLALAVLEALVDIIPVHRALRDDIATHAYGDQWPVDQEQEGVHYVLAIGEESDQHNGPGDIQNILKLMSDHRHPELQACLDGLPEDVMRYFVRLMVSGSTSDAAE